MAVNAKDLCLRALTNAGVVGVGQQPLPQDINGAFTRLNSMLAQWQIKRWLVWHLVETTYLSQGENSFLVGPGAPQFNMHRPDRIEWAFFRQTVPSQPNNIDYPLEEMKSWEDWANVALKTLKSFPSYFFYDSAFPIATLYAWPVPNAALYEVHILTKEVLAQFPALNSPFLLPPEYDAAIEWNLTRRLRVVYRKPKDEEVNALARESLNVIRMANVQITRLTMPPDLTRPGIYNVFSDQIR